MTQLRFLTAGESHGKAMVGIIEGLPHGLEICEDFINEQLQLRQKGYGRGGRQKIENDCIEILSGVSKGLTIGSPLAFCVLNQDYENWINKPSKPVHNPRPGHGDLAGALKFGLDDSRIILERASARETVNRVAMGAIAKLLLNKAGIAISSQIISAAGEVFAEDRLTTIDLHDPKSVYSDIETEAARRRFFHLVDQARKAGDTFGGVVEVRAVGAPPGLGSHVQWDRRLDAEIARSMMSIPSVKAVEIGEGLQGARCYGSTYHDPIGEWKSNTTPKRATNHAGGIEAGISNGEAIWCRVFIKPIATLRKGLPSIDLRTGAAATSDYERSDVTVVPAAAVVAENVLAWVVATAFLEKFGGDTLQEILKNKLQFEKTLNPRIPEGT